MLNQPATDFLIKLCENQSSDKYTVKDWDDIYAINSAINKEEIDEIWDQIKMNGCVDVKYFDDKEVCFAVTSKARLIVDDFKAIAAEANDENAIIKTDSMGRSVVVLPKGKTFENAIKSSKTKLKSFFWGLFGGIIGGIVGGSVVYTILHFIVGA